LCAALELGSACSTLRADPLHSRISSTELSNQTLNLTIARPLAVEDYWPSAQAARRPWGVTLEDAWELAHLKRNLYPNDVGAGARCHRC